MKRSPTYYQNRKILRELKDDCKFRPTVQDIEKWFDILNEQIFGNKLKPFNEIRVKRLHRTHAFFNYWTKAELREGKPNETSLEMHVVFDSEKFFVEILAHEMIHQFQHYYNEPLGHGPTFLAWSDNFKLKGLTLYKVA